MGVNPKVNNLIPAFQQARHDLVWIVDSTIVVDPDMLSRSMEAFLGKRMAEDVEDQPLINDAASVPSRGDVGLVHHIPYAMTTQPTWGSLVEQAFINTTHAKMYLAIVSLFKWPGINGRMLSSWSHA